MGIPILQATRVIIVSPFVIAGQPFKRDEVPFSKEYTTFSPKSQHISHHPGINRLIRRSSSPMGMARGGTPAKGTGSKSWKACAGINPLAPLDHPWYIPHAPLI